MCVSSGTGIAVDRSQRRIVTRSPAQSPASATAIASWQHRASRWSETLFDGVEFNDEIACVDVLYDLAFLLMDLWRRQVPRHANAVWNGYLAETGDFAGTLALSLAPSVGGVPGAVVLRSDEIRKRLCGVSPFERLGADGYTASVSDRVYAELSKRATLVVRAGHSAIVDAVYARPVDRRAIERAAAEAGVPFAGFWLEAPESSLLERVERRRHDASDADADVIRMQRTQETGAIGWHRLDASASEDAVLREATAALRARSRRQRGSSTQAAVLQKIPLRR